MNKTFTHNDIIRFIYGEMEGEEANLFEHSLKVDAQLKQSLEALTNTLEMIDSISCSKQVSDFTQLKIKSFARAYSSIPSKFIDRIDFIFN